MISVLVTRAIEKNPQLIGMEDVVEKEILHHELLNVLHSDVWDLAWLNQQNVAIEALLVEKKLEMRGKTQDDFLDSLEKQRGFVLTSDETKSDFKREMSRFVPKDIRERTLDRKEFWPYVGETISAQIGTIGAALSGDDTKRNASDMSM